MLKPQVLTNRLVAELKPDIKPYDIRDISLKGFYLRIYPGGAKTYHCECKRGKPITIGRSDRLAANQTRDQARIFLAEIIKGVDPQELIKKEDEPTCRL